MSAFLSFIFHSLLKSLRAASVIGGLEISNFSLRFSYYSGKEWDLVGVRLPPGIIEGGKIKDHSAFVEALKLLNRKITKSKRGKRVNIILSLASIDVYTQVFTLPAMEGEELEKAIALNLQMISPAEISTMYTGYQFLSRDLDHVELLGAFIHKDAMDGILRAFSEAKFFVVAAESKAVSLARFVRTMVPSFDPESAYVLVVVEDNGIEYIVIRNGQLYFEYFHSWQDFHPDEKDANSHEFEAAVLRSLNSVINFYNQHWKSPALKEIFFSGGALKERIKKVIEQQAGLTTKDVRLKDGELPSEWLVAFGCGIRGTISRFKDNEISLLGVSAREEYGRQLLVSYFDFWRVLTPAALSVLFAAFLLESLFMDKIDQGLAQQMSHMTTASQQEELHAFESRITKFNTDVKIIRELQASLSPKTPALEFITKTLRDNRVTVDRLAFTSYGVPITLSGLAPARENFIKFKNDLSASPSVRDTRFSYTETKQTDQGFSFSISFVIDAPAAPNT